MTKITSRRHPLVQRFRQLARRREADAVLLDGEHLLHEALDAGVSIDVVLSARDAGALVDRAKSAGAAVYQGTPAVLEAASPVQSSTGLVAIATWRSQPAATALDRAVALTLGLVDVQDPGNVGSVIRSADALGAGAVIALDGSADPAGWKALRGAMGSTFRIPVARDTLANVTREAHDRKIPIAATVTEGGRPLSPAELAGPMLLLLGNEGSGLDPDVLASADVRLTIPMRPGLNSLNVAVTAALVLWEARRFRDVPPS